MGIGDWLGFLAGRKASIERVANVRGLLWLGLLFVGSAALAREYDAEFIPYNPVVLAVPLIASTAAALLHAVKQVLDPHGLMNPGKVL